MVGGGFQFVDFIDEDNALLRAFDVVAGLVEQALQDGLDLIVDITRLRQRGGVSGDEGHAKHARERFAHQCFA